MILGLEINLTSSYDLSMVTSYFKRFVAGSRRFFPTSYEIFLKVGIILVVNRNL
jgi:hypothetical protein